MTKAIPYDIKKIINDKKYAIENNFKVKKNEKLFRLVKLFYFRLLILNSFLFVSSLK